MRVSQDGVAVKAGIIDGDRDGRKPAISNARRPGRPWMRAACTCAGLRCLPASGGWNGVVRPCPDGQSPHDRLQRSPGRYLFYAPPMTASQHSRVRPRARRRTTPRGAIVAALVACLLLLPALRTAGELHHAVAHEALPESLVHAAPGHHDHLAKAPSDAASVLHALMHLPAASAETVALVHALLAPMPASRPALPRMTHVPPRVATPAPGLPFRPPIVA